MFLNWSFIGIIIVTFNYSGKIYSNQLRHVWLLWIHDFDRESTVVLNKRRYYLRWNESAEGRCGKDGEREGNGYG